MSKNYQRTTKLTKLPLGFGILTAMPEILYVLFNSLLSYLLDITDNITDNITLKMLYC